MRWIADYAVTGRFDYLDIFEAPDIQAAMRVSALVRSYGHAHTKVWPALTWTLFKKIVHDLPGVP